MRLSMPADPNHKGTRIAKYIAAAGICSRREAEARITAGRVMLNGQKVTTPATFVTEDDVVMVDNQLADTPEAPRLFRYYKPRGLLTTNHDPEGRPTIFEAMPEGLPRLITVGRLDANSEGLLLLTTSGELARTMEHPSAALKRVYRVRASGLLHAGYIARLAKGITVDGVRYKPVIVRQESDGKGRNQWYRVELREGKNREIRKLFAHGGLEVSRLLRTGYGPYDLGDLPEGAVQEVRNLLPTPSK
jgi:23S rRNA pseudouridine2605 synthase